MLSLIHPKYDIFKNGMLWNYKELMMEYKEDLLNILCFLKILSSVVRKIVHYYLHFPFHMFVISHVLFQKQSLANVFYIRCFWKLCNIDRKAPVLESLLNKATDLKATNFTKKRLQHRGFPVNIAKFLGTPFFVEHLLCLALLFKLIRLTCYSENTFFT